MLKGWWEKETQESNTGEEKNWNEATNQGQSFRKIKNKNGSRREEMFLKAL